MARNSQNIEAAHTEKERVEVPAAAEVECVRETDFARAEMYRGMLTSFAADVSAALAKK